MSSVSDLIPCSSCSFFKRLDDFFFDIIFIFNAIHFETVSNILKNAFEVEFTKIGTVLCLNSIYGNSKIFGDKFDEYVAVCKFGYDGTHDTWVYSMYASEVFNKDNDVDLTPIAKFFGGGGHKHACGWTLSFNIFDRRSNVPYNHEPFITDMQKIDWGSYDEY